MNRENPLAALLRARPRARDEVTMASRSADARSPVIAEEADTGPARLSHATLDTMPLGTGGDDWRCLAEAIYFESRGEPLEGQIAVAEVVLNRVDDRKFPSTVCGVTHQGVGSGRACQFSYACDGRPEAMTQAQARVRSEKLASLMLAGRERSVTDGALFFHSRAVRPGWAGKMTRTSAIGHHLFYRPATQVASR